jgi:N-acyl-D-amino-acid deacylase
MRVDLLIKNGLVFDGTCSEPFKADVGISSDRIVFINKESGVSLRPMGSQKSVHSPWGIKTDGVIDAQNMAVAPGFIDTHAHSEFTLLADPRAEGKICQGITTEINGNCGLSAAPLYGEALHQREDDLKELVIRERWSTFEEYFQILEKRGMKINFVTLVGHGNLRASVIGYKDKTPDEVELKKMQTLLKEAISEGAVGLSTGLIYPPGIYSETEELIELSKVLSQSYNPASSPFNPSASLPDGRQAGPLIKGGIKKGVGAGGIYTTHMRSEGDKLIESIEETIRIGKEAGIKVHISHIKTSGKKNWHKIGSALSLMEESRNKGILLTCDRYPYTASSTDLDSILPSWAYSGGKEEELKRLKNSKLREKIKNQILNAHSFKDYWKKISISSVSSKKNRWMEGRNLHDIARINGKEPVDTLFDILIEEKLNVSAIFTSMHEENLKKFLSLSYCMIGTDSSARCFSGLTCKGKPHPRGFGSFPRFLGRYVSKEHLMSMSEGIYKITMLPAKTFGIYKRGIIKKGAYADIIIFDHQRIIDRATFQDPFLSPEGIYYVLVNGLPALWEGQLTGINAGRILKHGR